MLSVDVDFSEIPLRFWQSLNDAALATLHVTTPDPIPGLGVAKSSR
jgi:hypothetical protein